VAGRRDGDAAGLPARRRPRDDLVRTRVARLTWWTWRIPAMYLAGLPERPVQGTAGASLTVLPGRLSGPRGRLSTCGRCAQPMRGMPPPSLASTPTSGSSPRTARCESPIGRRLTPRPIAPSTQDHRARSGVVACRGPAHDSGDGSRDGAEAGPNRCAWPTGRCRQRSVTTPVDAGGSAWLRGCT
jgi:hypothetical protein